LPITVTTANQRPAIAWIGSPVPSEIRDALAPIGFSFLDGATANAVLAPDILGVLAGVVICQDEGRKLRAADDLKALACALVDHDCRVFVQAIPSGIVPICKVLEELRVPAVWPAQGSQPPGDKVFDGTRTHELSKVGEPAYPHVRVYTQRITASFLISSLTRFGPRVRPASASPGLFSIGGPAADILPEQNVLLRRAFFDCSSLHLEDLQPGNSGAKVWLAHATLTQEALQRRPLPFFVKIGPRRKIEQEHEAYEFRVRQHIPFHLAPRLVGERCALGTTNGILVGDFVEDSEPLAACAADGRASTAIGTLFERTLRGWHFQANAVTDSLHERLKWMLLRTVPVARVANANASRAPEEIEVELDKFGSESLLVGPVHGDLHVDNVRVRGVDAILIDFLSSSDGPLLTDPAALEMSLLVRAPRDDTFDEAAWLRVVGDLMTVDAFRVGPNRCDPTEKYAWLSSAVRQVRLHAFAMQRSPGQYCRALAYRLFQAATKNGICHPCEDVRRTHALGLASSLIDIAWDLQ
jgi:hypothetical protein